MGIVLERINKLIQVSTATYLTMSTTLESSKTTCNTATTVPHSSISTCDDHESFKKFFEFWLREQHQYLEQLSAAATSNHDDTEALKRLISRVMDHYKHYYETKSKWVKLNVLSMLTPSWRSSLEEAFLWIGGWLPSMAFHLLYSKAGLQLEDQLPEILRGLATNHDLSDLSSSQLCRVDQLQWRITKEERKITEKMAKHQGSMADASMVKLSHFATDSMKSTGGEGGVGSKGEVEEQLEIALRLKEEGLEELLQKADDLRLRTLKEIVDILTPIQAVHFLIAAAELHLRLHDWGATRDKAKHHVARD